jgi:hypothetical protein
MSASYCRSILNSKPTNRNEIQISEIQNRNQKKYKKDKDKKGKNLPGRAAQPFGPASQPKSARPNVPLRTHSRGVIFVLRSPKQLGVELVSLDRIEINAAVLRGL